MLHWPIGCFDKSRWHGAPSLPMPMADLIHDGIELCERFETPQTIFQVFGNSQPRTVPGGKFAEQNAGMFIVLLCHQRKMIREESDLFVG